MKVERTAAIRKPEAVLEARFCIHRYQGTVLIFTLLKCWNDIGFWRPPSQNGNNSYCGKRYTKTTCRLLLRGGGEWGEKREGLLGYKGWLWFRDWTKDWARVWGFSCINQNHVFTLSIYGTAVAPTSLCNSWPLVFPHNMSSIVRCTEVSLNSLSFLSFDDLHSPAFFKPLLRYDK